MNPKSKIIAYLILSLIIVSIVFIKLQLYYCYHELNIKPVSGHINIVCKMGRSDYFNLLEDSTQFYFAHIVENSPKNARHLYSVAVKGDSIFKQKDSHFLILFSSDGPHYFYVY
jgi:hypothetical protein